MTTNAVLSQKKKKISFQSRTTSEININNFFCKFAHVPSIYLRENTLIPQTFPHHLLLLQVCCNSQRMKLKLPGGKQKKSWPQRGESAFGTGNKYS